MTTILFLRRRMAQDTGFAMVTYAESCSYHLATSCFSASNKSCHLQRHNTPVLLVAFFPPFANHPTSTTSEKREDSLTYQSANRRWGGHWITGCQQTSLVAWWQRRNHDLLTSTIINSRSCSLAYFWDSLTQLGKVAECTSRNIT